MIKLSSLNGKQGRIVRETTAPFIVSEKGSERTEQIRVRYFSLSVKESKDFRSALVEKEKKSDLYVSDLLLPILESLPDIVDDNEKPVKVTIEMLDSFNAINLHAIRKAIEDDLAPKAQPAK